MVCKFLLCPHLLPYKHRKDKLFHSFTNSRVSSTFCFLKLFHCDDQKVIFAPFRIDSSCSAFLPSFGLMGERLKADLRERGCAVCGILSCTLFRGVQLKSYFKHHAITLCGSACTCTPLHVELFICLLHFQACLM